MKWEYKVAHHNTREGRFEDFLNTLGAEGWELVQYNIGASGQVITATLKRKAAS